MPETFDFDKADQNQEGWFFIECLGGAMGDHPIWKREHVQPITVELTVNGHPIPFTDGIRALFREAKRWADVKAAERLTENAEELQRKTAELLATVTAHVRQERKRLFPDVQFPDDER